MNGAERDELIKACIHCGFCLPTCPTYVLWGEEMDSPRGRIVLMREAAEAGSDMAAMAVHFDRCLGCMACTTSCPSGVQYDRLIEMTRPEVESRVERPWREKAFRRACFELFTHPGRLRALAPGAPLLRRLGAGGALRRFPRLQAMAAVTPPVNPAARRAPVLTPGRGERRGRVALLQGCVQRVVLPGVNAATVRVLSAEGFDVYAPPAPRCCGALHLHAGEAEGAAALARETIAALEGCDHVVTNAAGCGSALKDYVHLLAADPEWAARAQRFSASVQDVTELLAAVGPQAERHRLSLDGLPHGGLPRDVPIKVAYHDACHLAHAQKVRAQPRALLEGIPGLELVEPKEWEVCCGSAGVYNLFQPAAAAELGRRKAASLAATGATVIAAGNPGCTLQITAHSAPGTTVLHPVELLDRSLNPVTSRAAALPPRTRSGGWPGGRSGRRSSPA